MHNGDIVADSKPKQYLTGNLILSSVTKWLPSRDEHSDYWWNMAGPHFSALLQNAGYSSQAQYETLLFIYHQITPRLGPSPLLSNADRLDSGLSLDGTRFEYSWRWNQSYTKPEVRMVVEPFSRFAGTYMDPLNIRPSMETLYSMKSQVPSLDMTLFNHFIAKLYDSEWHRYLDTNERPIVTNVCLGFEFKGSEILPKAYFFPRKLGQSGLTPMRVWEDAIITAIPQSPTVATVFSFVQNDAPRLGLTLAPLWLGIDVVNPVEARLKFYCVESRTSFDSVKSIMTMGGIIEIASDMLAMIWDLMKAVCDLPDDFPQDKDLPRAPQYNPSTNGIDAIGLWGTFAYYFDIGLGRGLPDVKFYIPVCHYGTNDQTIASATANWMKKNSRGQYVDAFWDTMHKIISHRKLDESRGAQMWLSMMVKQGELQVTTYIAPEGFHPKRGQGHQLSHRAVVERVTGSC
ncbi:aromatic prenyltransferase [Colletotrichum graminicola]|uniref:Aromatic prenyltransferase n=1 Tax=Colletotrichum graminicola (strain M1.001 / M2 / FGSC 10212) TaxID=645133 RepID=E3QZW8_COLGM|nr:aromatic prenyltransferase [Colletotrichum graminicola M1.001]EFQ36406.1 aromatic prenyltransferase [Colletotrichum graminicola M1.001]WDK18416.1 aromatic prenyltransferase [Colletotrichum graminicola]